LQGHNSSTGFFPWTMKHVPGSHESDKVIF
jgi:hypothetical protein